MADEVQISANEMKFFIKRSLEGMGFNPGEQIEAGRRVAVAWQYGLVDSALLSACLRHLKPSIHTPSLVSQQDHRWVFDALGQSALVQVELAVGMALAKHGKQVTINNVHDGVLLAPALMGWLSMPLSNMPANQPMVLYFQKQTAHAIMQPHGLVINAQGQLQGLYQAPAINLPTNQLQVVIGEGARSETETNHNLGQCVMDAKQLADHKIQCLAQGLRIGSSLLQELKTLIVESFVPESENSQAGAGPG